MSARVAETQEISTFIHVSNLIRVELIVLWVSRIERPKQ
jgi:hypothetical protein